MEEEKYKEYVELYKKHYININTNKQIRNFRIYNNIFIPLQKITNKDGKLVISIENALKKNCTENKIWINQLNEIFLEKIELILEDYWNKIPIDKVQLENYGNNLNNKRELKKYLSGSMWYKDMENNDIYDVLIGIIINQIDMSCKLINDKVRTETKNSIMPQYNNELSKERIKDSLNKSIKESKINIDKKNLEKYLLDYKNYEFKKEYLDLIYNFFAIYLMIYLKIKVIAIENYNNNKITKENEFFVKTEYENLFEKFKMEDVW